MDVTDVREVPVAGSTAHVELIVGERAAPHYAGNSIFLILAPIFRIVRIILPKTACPFPAMSVQL